MGLLYVCMEHEFSLLRHTSSLLGLFSGHMDHIQIMKLYFDIYNFYYFLPAYFPTKISQNSRVLHDLLMLFSFTVSSISYMFTITNCRLLFMRYALAFFYALSIISKFHFLTSPPLLRQVMQDFQMSRQGLWKLADLCDVTRCSYGICWQRINSLQLPSLFHCSFKANSHIACRAHAAPMPLPYHAVPLRV